MVCINGVEFKISLTNGRANVNCVVKEKKMEETIQKYWGIREIGNGYVVHYPYYLEGDKNCRTAELFGSSFDEALEILKKNSMEPTPEG